MKTVQEACLLIWRLWNIEHIHQESTNCKGFPLCADDVKRLMFIQNATTHATADSLERTEQSTDTWDAFATALRLALARRQSCNATSNQHKNQHKANVAATLPPVPEDMGMACQVSDAPNAHPMDLTQLSVNGLATLMTEPFVINALSANWKVGHKLWKDLSSALQQKLSEIRNDKMGSGLGKNANAKQANKAASNKQFSNQTPQSTRENGNGNRDIVKAPVKEDHHPNATLKQLCHARR